MGSHQRRYRAAEGKEGKRKKRRIWSRVSGKRAQNNQRRQSECGLEAMCAAGQRSKSVVDVRSSCLSDQLIEAEAGNAHVRSSRNSLFWGKFLLKNVIYESEVDAKHVIVKIKYGWRSVDDNKVKVIAKERKEKEWWWIWCSTSKKERK